MFPAWLTKTFSSFASASLYYHSDAFLERIIARFRKQYSEKIAECSDSCIHSGLTYPIDDLWIGSLMLADITEQFFRNYCALFSERERGGTWDLDNDSFRYKSSQPRLLYCVRVSKWIYGNQSNPAMINFRWDAATPCFRDSSLKDMRHVTLLQRWKFQFTRMAFRC